MPTDICASFLLPGLDLDMVLTNLDVVLTNVGDAPLFVELGKEGTDQMSKKMSCSKGSDSCTPSAKHVLGFGLKRDWIGSNLEESVLFS
jgi:hypothetical protein